MKFEEKILVMCLSGLIKKECHDEQAKCLNAIKNQYGGRIAGYIKDYLDAV